MFLSRFSSKILSKSPFFNFSSSLPLVFKRFSPKSDPTNSFSIKSLDESEINETAALISKVYGTRENVFRTIQLPESELYESLQKDLKKAMENDLCLICKDEKQNKIAGAIYYRDLIETVNESTFIDSNIVNLSEKWGQLEEFYQYCLAFVREFSVPKKKNDILLLHKIAVDREFSGLEIGKKLMYVARFLHPKVTKANRRLMIATHNKTYEFCKGVEWELLTKIDYTVFRDKKNNKIFEQMQKLKDRSDDDKFVYIMKFENEGRDALKERKKWKDLNEKN